ncbi:MAG TPA: DUF4286 family protein [Phycisphaerae bacterium]|nr:DUF4286 family protein [Phycisphaerae bacterium]HRW55377.1 DUF4286 family protein [Phycisphaerae bacterium]
MSMLYEVNAEFDDPRIAESWETWILDEHIADVVAAGAESGTLLRVDSDDGVSRLSVHYRFSSRAALEIYLRDHSPRLRDEGLRRFPLEAVRYSRRVAAIVEADESNHA